MIKIKKLHSGFIMTGPDAYTHWDDQTNERAISTIPELRRAIGGFCVGIVNKGSEVNYTIEVKGVKE